MGYAVDVLRARARTGRWQKRHVADRQALRAAHRAGDPSNQILELLASARAVQHFRPIGCWSGPGPPMPQLIADPEVCERRRNSWRAASGRANPQ